MEAIIEIVGAFIEFTVEVGPGARRGLRRLPAGAWLFLVGFAFVLLTAAPGAVIWAVNR
jgi:xanthine/uracil/vitamin C permease (AzgA family)